MTLTEVRDPEWTFGERLAKARRDADLTQEQMAEELHVSPSTVAKWETDRGQPRGLFKVVRRWAEITAVRGGWLLSQDSPK